MTVLEKLSGIVYNKIQKGVVEIITIQEQIETALIHSGLNQKEFCEKIGMSPSSLIQRMKTGKFTKPELERMASAMGCEYISHFRFPDGKEY